MNLVDVHAHLTDDRFKTDLDLVLERAKEAGVKAIICNGTNPKNNREVLALAKKHDIIKVALGAYPTDALGFEESETGLVKSETPWDVDKELEFIESQKQHIIAIGEVGLEYKYVTDELQRKLQVQNLKKILALAERIKKPVILHTRGAEAETIELLQSSTNKKVLLHCFGGKKSLVRKANDLGYSLSIPPVCVRLQHFGMVVDESSVSNLLTETDAPWLSAVAGERNEPKNVLESIRFIANKKKFDVDETANSIFLNYQRLFL